MRKSKDIDGEVKSSFISNLPIEKEKPKN